MRTIHVCPRRLKEFLPTHPLYKSPPSLATTRMRREDMHLDNAREFHSKSTVAVPEVRAALHDLGACRHVCKPYVVSTSGQRTTLLHCQRRSRSTLYLTQIAPACAESTAKTVTVSYNFASWNLHNTGSSCSSPVPYTTPIPSAIQCTLGNFDMSSTWE